MLHGFEPWRLRNGLGRLDRRTAVGRKETVRPAGSARARRRPSAGQEPVSPFECRPLAEPGVCWGLLFEHVSSSACSCVVSDHAVASSGATGGAAQPDLAEEGLHPSKEGRVRCSPRIATAILRPRLTGSSRHRIPPLSRLAVRQTGPSTCESTPDYAHRAEYHNG